MSQRQRNILELIQEDPTISLDSIAKAIGVSAPTIDLEIVKMSHLIKRIGPKKGGHWEIINNS
ncbi:MAG: AsnC family protein [Bacteroides sp.]|nr:AsnC family protein [Bacteroides sp.]